MTINDLCELATFDANKKGWYDPPVKTILEHLMNAVMELAEAGEEVRKGSEPVYYNPESRKPEGVLIEIADCIIWLADLCGRRGWDLEAAIKLKMDYNRSRPYRNGKVL